MAAFNDTQLKQIQAASKPATTPVKMAPQPDVPPSVMAERQARNRNTPNQGGTITTGGKVYEYAGSPSGQNVKPTVTPQAEYQKAAEMAKTTPVEAPRAAAPAPSAAPVAPVPQAPAAKPMPGPAFGQTSGPAALGATPALAAPPAMRLFEHAYNVPTMSPPAAPTMGPAPAPVAPPAAPPAGPAAPSQPSFFGTDRDNAANQERVKAAMSSGVSAVGAAATGIGRRFNPANYEGPTKGSASVLTYRPPQPKVKTPALDTLPVNRRLGFTSNGGRIQPGQDRRSLFGQDNPGAKADMDRLKSFGRSTVKNIKEAF